MYLCRRGRLARNSPWPLPKPWGKIADGHILGSVERIHYGLCTLFSMEAEIPVIGGLAFV